jgi:hypothetical protein
MAVTLTSTGITFSDGTSQNSAASAVPYVGQKGQIFTSSGTWTAPTGVTTVGVTLLAGGGGGGGTSATNTGGGGGGSGGAGMGWVTVTPGTTYAVTVGAAGTAGGAGAAGGAGGGSSFGTLITATGGGGGLANRHSGGGGAAGTATVPSGGLVLAGGAGGAGSRAHQSACCGSECSHSSYPYGLGGNGASVNAGVGVAFGWLGYGGPRGPAYGGCNSGDGNGSPATGYGAGGGGGSRHHNNRVGGSGKPGVVILTY